MRGSKIKAFAAFGVGALFMGGAVFLRLNSKVASRVPASDAGMISDFDAFMNAVDGQLPMDPAAFGRELTREGGTLRGLVIPNGRSPERRFTSIEHPRNVFAWHGEGSATSGPIVLMAEVPALEQLQFISLNPNTGAAEFRVLHGYRSRDGSVERVDLRRAKRANEAACMACHQAGGAVFSNADWSESMRDPNAAIFIAPQVERDFLKLTKSDMSRQMMTWPGFATDQAPLVYRSGVAFQVEDLGAFEVRQTALNQCLYGCGENLECRQEMLASVLIAATNEAGYFLVGMPAGRSYRVDQQLNATRAHYQMPRNGLADRPETRKTGNYRIIKKSEGGMTNEDPLEPRGFNFPRAQEGLFIKPSLCFGLRPGELNALYARDRNIHRWSQMARAPELAALAAAWPPTREEILKSVEAVWQSAPLPPLPPRPAPQLSARAPRTPALVHPRRDGEPESLFKAYCLSCHAVDTSTGGELPLEDIAKLSAYVGDAERTARELLKRHLMPPVHAPQPSPVELESMLQALGER